MDAGFLEPVRSKSMDAQAPFVVAAGAGERLRFGEVEVLVRVSAESTGWAFTLTPDRAGG